MQMLWLIRQRELYSLKMTMESEETSAPEPGPSTAPERLVLEYFNHLQGNNN